MRNMKKWQRTAALALALLFPLCAVSGRAAETAENPTAVETASAEPERAQITAPEASAPSETTAETTAPATETAAPEATDTAAPAQTDTPAPAETDAPAPVETDTPAATETAAPSDTPAPSETTQAPSVSPSASPEASAEPSSTPDAGEKKIVESFALPENPEAKVQEKPALEEVLAKLPSTIGVHLSDGTEAEAAISWSCADYSEDKAEYQFVAALTDPAFAVAEGVALPTFRLIVEGEQRWTSGAFVFKRWNEQGLMLIAYGGESAEVEIPDSVEGLPVLTVARSAFAQNAKLQKVIVPKGVIALEDGAFSGCTSLVEVELPDSLEFAGSSLFDGCGALKILRVAFSMESRSADNLGFARTIYDEQTGQSRDVAVRFEQPITDYRVLAGGSWAVNGNLTIPAEHELRVDGGAGIVIGENAVVTVLGRLTNEGIAVCRGKILACGGTVVNVEENVVRDHSWSDGVCTVCGARQTTALSVSLKAERAEKVYDGTPGIELSAEDFQLNGAAEGDEVSIGAIAMDFDASAAGSYLIPVEFALAGAQAEHYTASPIEIEAAILPRPVTLTPKSGQSKSAGQSDPTLKATYRGVVEGETLSGRLSREPGESVGKYRITLGTLAEQNPNYALTLEEGYFEITAKPMHDASISVGKISNQRYTGAAITPSVQVRDGQRALEEGKDYELSYSDNTAVGMATVTIRGKGEYTGERAATFLIIQAGGGSSSGSSAAAFMSAAGEVATQTVVEEAPHGDLKIGGESHGSILFDENDFPREFVQLEQTWTEDGEARRMLMIDAQAAVNDEDGIESFGMPRLRLSMETIEALKSAGYTDISLVVDGVQARLPLSTLYAEYVTMDGAARVSQYELRLWPMEEEQLSEADLSVLSGCVPQTKPCHFELVALETTQAGATEEDDVLSLLDGVELLLVPDAEPDYQNRDYFVRALRIDDPETPIDPAKAEFIMDQGQVKCRIVPVFGGVFTLTDA